MLSVTVWTPIKFISICVVKQCAMCIKRLILVLVVLFVNCESSRESQCIDYYKTGNNFDLTTLQGNWYAVYFWPPNSRQRRSCEVINFKKSSQDEIISLQSACSSANVSGNMKIVQSSYVNNVGKLTTVTYYGDDEVKSLYRSCDRIYKYLFIPVKNNYVMGINCSSGGRGVLLAKYLESATAIQSTVESIDAMNGREGSPDCPLKL
ncbi:uncharacterized protein LOC133527428 [Cydia pomonella]|uniref:uncharacterized protein LOC133527353 n=1 Tax=Cydia pomonella TaxID=82600 RepID=UPI002ADD5071|nr:uncharacterized protein LOC133527353 [Cydia pomonella]XP_061720423.1 uncharacterized protein LOC133527428 [Cydia pomonella]